MKLYTRRWADDPHWDGGWWVYEEVTPADLEAGYYGLVEGIKKVLLERQRFFEELVEESRPAQCNQGLVEYFQEILAKIANLESSVDLGELRETRRTVKMPTWKIPCTWEMEGWYDVKANTLEIAMKKAIKGNRPYDAFPPNQEFVENSFRLKSINETKKLNQ